MMCAANTGHQEFIHSCAYIHVHTHLCVTVHSYALTHITTYNLIEHEFVSARDIVERRMGAISIWQKGNQKKGT